MRDEGNLHLREFRTKRGYLIQKLLRGAPITPEDLETLPSDLSLELQTPSRILLIQLGHQFPQTGIPAVEPEIYHLFRNLGLTLYCFQYPREYLAVLPEPKLTNCRETLSHFGEKHKGSLCMGIGKCASPQQLMHSYQTCQIALKSAQLSGTSCVFFDQLYLELLLSDVSSDLQQEYFSRTVAHLSSEDRELLLVYYEENMSLVAVCERLYLHKNTLQYRLNRIRKVTGLIPGILKMR